MVRFSPATMVEVVLALVSGRGPGDLFKCEMALFDQNMLVKKKKIIYSKLIGLYLVIDLF